MRPSQERPGWFRIELTVQSTDAARSLSGPVVFHIHDTFREPDRTVKSEQGVARLRLRAYGAFTVGAECDGGATRLELDLSELDEAPVEFRAR